MPYKILRLENGWIPNENGDFLLEDTDNNSQIWVTNNLIGFNSQNQPFIRQENQDDNNLCILNVQYVNPNTEENVGESSSSTQNIEKKNNWTNNETCALITAVESRYDDMHHVHKRKTFWNIVSEELSGQNITFSSEACKKKWLNLIRTYKSTKDMKSKTGRGPVKFEYFHRLDELLGESPSNASSHSIDLSLETENMTPLDISSHNAEKKKRKNPTMELTKLKKKFYEEKTNQIQVKETNRRWYIEESIRNKQDRNELYKKKLEMEERKVKVLEELRDLLKDRNI